MSLEWAIQALTSRPAKASGFIDRGVLAPGMKADLNIIDLHRLYLPQPEVVCDLPGGGQRTVHREGLRCDDRRGRGKLSQRQAYW